ncbi:hypothetical protein ACFDR9_001304 [Janthinobacterium sp. CG_23.3]
MMNSVTTHTMKMMRFSNNHALADLARVGRPGLRGVRRGNEGVELLGR